MILFGIDSESKGNDISMGHWSVYLYLNITNHLHDDNQCLLTANQQNRRIISFYSDYPPIILLTKEERLIQLPQIYPSKDV